MEHSPAVGDILTLEMGEMTHGGECIAHFAGAAIFVRGAIPGEVLKAEITEKRARYYRALALEVLSASENRVEHPWPVGSASQTGVADFGHISLFHQRELKKQIILGQIRRVGGEKAAEIFSARDFKVQGADSGDGWHMRSRTDLVKLKHGFGMHSKRRKELIRLTDMRLADARLENLELFGTKWDGFIPEGSVVRALASAQGDLGIAADGKFWTAPGVKGPDFVREYVEIGYCAGRKKTFCYRLSPRGFWQVHRYAPRTLVREAMRALKPQPGMRAVDLYCGAGLFTLPLADAVGERGRVSGYELNSAAVESARFNLREFPWARASAAEIDAQNVGELVRGADVILADPARSGLKIPTVRKLAESGAQRILLISCDVASMARDVGAFIDAGMNVESFRAFDIFPHTHHVESVVLMSRAD